MSGLFTSGTRDGSNGRASDDFDYIASGRQKCTVPFVVIDGTVEPGHRRPFGLGIFATVGTSATADRHVRLLGSNRRGGHKSWWLKVTKAAVTTIFLSIPYPGINDLIDVCLVPDDADLGVFRSQPTGIDTDNPIYRKLVIAGRQRVGFKDVV
jgi:hypothetical protein